jgi:hypothetical protein
VKRPKRKQPFGYILARGFGQSVKVGELGVGRPLAVLGHYESPCGGCDTIKTFEEVYKTIRDCHAAGYDVLFEGLLLTTETQRLIQLHEDGLPLLVIALDVPVDVCIDSINARRRAKKPDAAPVKEAGTRSKHRTCQRGMTLFQSHGMTAEWHDRESALKRIREELRI